VRLCGGVLRLRIGLGLVVMMIALSGGQIVPSYSRSLLARREAGRLPVPPMQEFVKLALLALLSGRLAWVALPEHPETGAVLLHAGALHAVRLARWAGDRTLAEPLVAVLHLGNAFLPLGAVATGAAGCAPFVPLGDWAPWQVYLPLAAMLPVCLILALAIARPNSFSFGGGRNNLFDPARTGIVRLRRHPLLAAPALWAAAHAVPNGDLAHLVLFGSFAVLGRRLLDRRRQRGMGADGKALRDAAARAPLSPRTLTGDPAIRLALCAALIWLHPAVIGVSPLP
jgi:uncharacterized membrane protein